jgi:tetratricopeptide (TPR) repeat protein
MRTCVRIGVTIIVFAASASSATPLAAQTPAQSALQRGMQLYEAGDREAARRHLEPVAAGRHGDPEAAYYLGRIALESGDWDGAVKWLERAVSLAPEVATYHVRLGQAYGQKAQRASRLQQPGLATKVRASLTRALDLDPDNVDAHSGLIDFHLIAPRIMGGNKATALEHARAIQARNAYLGSFLAARVHASSNEPDRAIQELRSLMAAFPDSAAPAISLAVLHHGRQEWAAAMQVLRPLAAASPPRWSAVYQVGRTGALSGDYLDEAERALRRYLAHEPAQGEASHTAAHWRLGMVLEHRGDRVGARAAYEAALRLDPGYDEARKALNRLR